MQRNNWIQFVGLLIIVGFSVISWLYRKLNEQAAKKRAKDMIEERQREMLRTGRDPGTVEVGLPPPEIAESQRQMDITARREAQLAELRRRAQMRQQQGPAERPMAGPTGPHGAPPVAPPITNIPGSMGPTVPQRRTPFEATRQAPRGQPQPRPQQRPQQRQQQRPQKQARPVKPAPAPAPRPMEIEEETTHRLVKDEAARRPSPVVSGAPQTPEEWRKAIIANEILSAPLAMRTKEVPLPF